MDIEFWTTLIKVTRKPTGEALQALEANWRDDSASAASGPGAACEVVTPEVIPPGVHDDAPEAAGLFDAEDEGRPF